MNRPSYLIVIAFSLLIASCATTKQARTVKQSGFLDDYSLLQPGGEGRALYVYRNPEANFAAYDKILIDRVSIWEGPGSKLGDVDTADLRRLVFDLHTAVKQKLEEDYEIVDQPGPTVMRVRIALTEAGKSKAALDIFSTIVPQARILSAGKSMVTGTESFVGAASVEAEITDATTGELMIAAVDRRAGGKSLKGSSDPWSDVHFAFAYWAQRLKDRLAEERAKP